MVFHINTKEENHTEDIVKDAVKDEDYSINYLD